MNKIKIILKNIRKYLMNKNKKKLNKNNYTKLYFVLLHNNSLLS